MMNSVKYIGSDSVSFEFGSMSTGESVDFHPMKYSHADLGKMLYLYGNNDMEFYIDSVLCQDPIKSYNDAMNSIPRNLIGKGNPSTISEWDQYGQQIGYDYKYVREKISALTLVISTTSDDYDDWDLVEPEDKEIAVRYMAVPANMVITYCGGINAVYKSIIEEWVRLSKECRHNRMEAAKVFIFECIIEAKQLLVDVNSSLVPNYYEGIEGTLEDEGVEGLFDFLESRVGTSYENNGLAETGYTLIGSRQWTDVVDGVMDILKYGDYNP